MLNADTNAVLPFRFQRFSEAGARQGNVEPFSWNPILPLGETEPAADESLIRIVTDSGRVVSEMPPDPTGKHAAVPQDGYPSASASESDMLLIEARGKAAEIVSAAEAEVGSIRESAEKSGWDSGYADGFAVGKANAEAEQATALQQTLQYYLEDIKRVVEAVEAGKDELLEQYLEDLRELAVAVAEKVISISLKSSGQVIEKMIISATERMKNRQWVKIGISKYDADLMMQGDMDIIDSMRNISDNVKVTVIESEEPGACIIEFPDQIIDAGVKTQLRNIREMLDIENSE